MKLDVALGLGLGSLLAALSIAGNIRRGDPHLVSVFPGLIIAIVLPIGIYLLMRRMSSEADRDDLTLAGMRMTTAAASLFALAIAAFAWWWFPTRPVRLVAFLLFGTLVATWVLGLVASLVLARLVGRGREFLR